MNVSPSRRYDVWAASLLLVDLAVGQLAALRGHHGLFAPAPGSLAIGIGIGTVALLLVLIACIHQGVRWAKILYVALFVLGLLTLPFTYKTVFFDTWAAVRYVSHFLVQLVVSALILKSFRRNKQAAAAPKG